MLAGVKTRFRLLPACVMLNAPPFVTFWNADASIVNLFAANPETPPLAVAIVQVYDCAGLKLVACPGDPARLSDVILIVNGLPAVALIVSAPVMFTQSQPGLAPFAPLAWLISQT